MNPRRTRRTLGWDQLEDRRLPAAPVGAGVATAAVPPVSEIPAERNDPGAVFLHGLYTAQAARTTPSVVFYGDSETYGFAYGPGSSVWARSIAPLDAADFGVLSDATQNVLWRVENGELPAAHPRVIVVQIGANNLGTLGESTQVTLAGIENLVKVMHALSPTSKILLVGMLPVGTPQNVHRPEIVSINYYLARFVDNRTTFFLDLSPALLAIDGTLNAVDNTDLVHLNAAGYQIWADDMLPLLDELLASHGVNTPT